MGPSHSLFFLSLTLSSILRSSSELQGILEMVFKGCADQDFQDPGGISNQNLKTLLDTLVSQSSAAKFYKSTSGDGSPYAINGLFQCRGDISGDDCKSCVKKTLSLAQTLCGQAIIARVQLKGCHLRYEISGFKQTNATQLIYKVCGSDRPVGSGFGDILQPALGEIVKGVGNGGFYAADYESVYVLGQCDGDLSGGDCENCVKNAIEKANSECGGSISAQIFLQKCYISYTYYPGGVPSSLRPHSMSGAGRWWNKKRVAIALGVIVGLLLLLSCFLYAKSLLIRKRQKQLPRKNLLLTSKKKTKAVPRKNLLLTSN